MPLPTTDVRAILADHLQGDALEDAVARLCALRPSELRGTFAMYDSDTDEGTHPLAWRLRTSDTHVMLQIERADDSEGHLRIDVEVRSATAAGEHPTGQAAISIGTGDLGNFVDVRIERDQVDFVDTHGRLIGEVDLDVSEQIRFRGPSVTEIDAPSEITAAAAAALRQGLRAGTRGRKRWVVEIPESLNDEDRDEIAGLIEDGAVEGEHPEWRLRTDPSAHEVMAVLARSTPTEAAAPPPDTAR